MLLLFCDQKRKIDGYYRLRIANLEMGRVVMLLELGSTNFSQNLRIASLYLEGPSIYYFRKTNGWVGLQNGQFC